MNKSLWHIHVFLVGLCVLHTPDNERNCVKMITAHQQPYSHRLTDGTEKTNKQLFKNGNGEHPLVKLYRVAINRRLFCLHVLQEMASIIHSLTISNQHLKKLSWQRGHAMDELNRRTAQPCGSTQFNTWIDCPLTDRSDNSSFKIIQSSWNILFLFIV